MWFFLLALLSAYGIARGNDWYITGKECMAGCHIGIFFILGSDDRFWYKIEKPLTIMFYIGALLVATFSNTPVVQAIGDVVLQDYNAPISTAGRNINSLGYSLRPLMASGLLLGMWGLVRKGKPIWRFLQVSALFVTLACDVGLFVFRGTFLAIVLVGLSYLLLLPFLKDNAFSAKSVFILTAGAIGFIVFAESDVLDRLQRRLLEETQTESLWGSRNAELRAYLDQVRWEALVGRGIGGTFDATGGGSWSKSTSIGLTYRTWGVLHYGILIFSLKGGIVMLALFASWLTPGLRHRPRRWYTNPCNLTAALLFPLYLLILVTNPLPFSVEGLLFMLALMVPLSRFSRRLAPYRIATPGVCRLQTDMWSGVSLSRSR